MKKLHYLIKALLIIIMTECSLNNTFAQVDTLNLTLFGEDEIEPKFVSGTTGNGSIYWDQSVTGNLKVSFKITAINPEETAPGSGIYIYYICHRVGLIEYHLDALEHYGGGVTANSIIKSYSFSFISIFPIYGEVYYNNNDHKILSVEFNLPSQNSDSYPYHVYYDNDSVTSMENNKIMLNITLPFPFNLGYLSDDYYITRKYKLCTYKENNDNEYYLFDCEIDTIRSVKDSTVKFKVQPIPESLNNITYQWERGKKSNPNSDEITWENKPCTNDEYEIVLTGDSILADSGYYRCKVNDGIDDYYTNPTFLDINTFIVEIAGSGADEVKWVGYKYMVTNSNSDSKLTKKCKVRTIDDKKLVYIKPPLLNNQNGESVQVKNGMDFLDNLYLYPQTGDYFGHMPFEYEFKNNRNSTRNAILNLHTELGVYPTNSPNTHTGWYYYKNGEYPVSMLIPPNNTFPRNPDLLLKKPILLIHGLTGVYGYSKDGAAHADPNGNDVSYWYTTPRLINTNYNNLYHGWQLYYPNNDEITKIISCINFGINYLYSKYNTKINVVTHSYGGLNTFMYMQQPISSLLVKKVLFLAPPFHGSAGANNMYYTFSGTLAHVIHGDDNNAPCYRDCSLGSSAIWNMNNMSLPDLNGDGNIFDDYFVILGTTSSNYLTQFIHSEAAYHHDGAVSISSGSLLDKGIGFATIWGNHNDCAHGQSNLHNNLLIPDIINSFITDSDYPQFILSLNSNNQINTIVNYNRSVIKPDNNTTLTNLNTNGHLTGDDANYQKGLMNFKYINVPDGFIYPDYYNVYYLSPQYSLFNNLIPFLLITQDNNEQVYQQFSNNYSIDIMGSYLRYIGEVQLNEATHYFYEENPFSQFGTHVFSIPDNSTMIKLYPINNNCIPRVINYNQKYCESQLLTFNLINYNYFNKAKSDIKQLNIISSGTKSLISDSLAVPFYIDDRTSQVTFILSDVNLFQNFQSNNIMKIKKPDGTIITASTLGSNYSQDTLAGFQMAVFENPQFGTWHVWAETNQANSSGIKFTAQSFMMSEIYPYILNDSSYTASGSVYQASCGLMVDSISLLDSVHVNLKVFYPNDSTFTADITNSLSFSDSSFIFNYDLPVDSIGFYTLKYSFTGVYNNYNFERIITDAFTAVDITPKLVLTDIFLDQYKPYEDIYLKNSVYCFNCNSDSAEFSYAILSNTMDTSSLDIYYNDTTSLFSLYYNLQDTGEVTFIVNMNGLTADQITDTLVVHGRKTDISVQNAGISPDSIITGTPISIHWEVSNNSNYFAASSILKIYISEDLQIDPSDLLLSTVNLPALPPDSVYPDTVNIIIPENVQNGTWHIILFADAENQLNEINELNNIMVIGSDVYTHLNAYITANDTLISCGNSAHFSVVYTGYPLTIEWHFEGGLPSIVENSEDPTVLYNISGIYNVSVILTDSVDTLTIVKPAYISVQPVCNNLRFPLSGSEVTYYLTGSSTGYCTGNNSYGHKAKAEYFDDFPPASKITGGKLKFGVAMGTASNMTVAVWDNSGTNGAPGSTPLATTNIPMSQVIYDCTNHNYTNFQFQAPINVTGPFYMGIILPTSPGDTIALTSNHAGEANPCNAWEMWNNNTWHSFVSDWNGGLNVQQSIFPLLCNDTSILVTRFKASDTIVNVNENISFTDISYGNPIYFNWDFGDGSISTQKNPVHSYNFPGYYSVRLIINNGFQSDTLFKHFYITVHNKIWQKVNVNNSNGNLQYSGNNPLGNGTTVTQGYTIAQLYWSNNIYAWASPGGSDPLLINYNCLYDNSLGQLDSVRFNVLVSGTTINSNYYSYLYFKVNNHLMIGGTNLLINSSWVWKTFTIPVSYILFGENDFIVGTSQYSQSVVVMQAIQVEWYLHEYPRLSVNPHQITIDNNSNDLLIEIENSGFSNLSWYANIFNSGWLSFSSSGNGLNNGTLFLHANQNYSSQRSGKIIISAINSLNSPDTVTIYQGAAPHPAWNYSISSANHTILVQQSAVIQIYSNPISIGDYLGVFYDSSGTLKCGGYMVWQGISDAFSAWGNDDFNNGFNPGETFHWKIWKASENSEYDAVATYDPAGFPSQGFFETNGLSCLLSLVVDSISCQSISLPQGWSIFSTYIDPVNPNISNVLYPVVSDIIIVKDGGGNVFWPQYGVNEIGNMQIGKGYLVKTQTQVMLEICGTAMLPENTPISIPSGWSILAYLRSSPASIDTLLYPIQSEIIIIKNGNGLVYWPQYEVDDIGNMLPGEGYQIKAYNSCIFTYPANSQNILMVYNTNETYKSQLILNTGNNMTLLIPIDYFQFNNDNLYGSDPNWEINVLTNDGLLVGKGAFNSDNIAITIWGDDELTQEKDGLLCGEPFNLKLWDSQSNTEVPIIVNNWLTGSQYYEINRISVAGSIIFLNRTNNHVILYQNVPNPFNGTSTIRYYLPVKMFIKLDIYDMIGNKVKSLIEGTENAGTHSIEFYSNTLLQGIYLYKLEFPSGIEVKMMSILK